MTVRLLGLLVISDAALAAQAQKVPLATFTGAVHGVSKKSITIQNEEGNLVDFEINGKTRVMSGKKEIRSDDLKTGDLVSIEARQEYGHGGQFLVAVAITVMPLP